MKVDTNCSGDRRILIAKISATELSEDPRDAARSWSTLSELIISAIRSDQPPGRSTVPLVVIDLSEANPQAKTFEQWFLGGMLTKTNRVLDYVGDRGGRIVFSGLSQVAKGTGLSFASSLEKAIEVLRTYHAELKTDLDSKSSDVLTQLGSSKICLAGCPQKDVGSLSDEFRNLGINVIPGHSVGNGDKIVFCISACHGPTEGTRQSIGSLYGKSVFPIAIVLTYGDLVDDDSLRELVNVEERELLTKVLPADIVDDLPLFLDVDPNLLNKIAAQTKKTVSEVQCLKAP